MCDALELAGEWVTHSCEGLQVTREQQEKTCLC